jgi:hypothetical protein
MEETETQSGLPFDTEELLASLAGMRDELAAAVERAGRQLELERRMRETPWTVIGVSAGIGFLLGGGLWPVVRPFARAAARGLLTPANLVGLAAAVSAMRKGRQEVDADELGDRQTH